MPDVVDLPAVGGWLLVIVFAVVVLDVLVPFLPGETVVVAAGVAAAEHGRPVPVLLVLVTAAAVLTGDLLAYRIGCRGGPAVVRRLRRGRRGAALHDWVVAVMREHGALLLVLGRYLPGVRSVACFTAGAVAYPIRRYAAFTLLAAVLWAVQAVLLGYLSGVAFAGRPLFGFGAAWLVAVAVSVVAVVVQRRLARSRSRPATARRRLPIPGAGRAGNRQAAGS